MDMGRRGNNFPGGPRQLWHSGGPFSEQSAGPQRSGGQRGPTTPATSGCSVAGGLDANASYGSLNDLWMFNPGTMQWTWVSGSSTRQRSGCLWRAGRSPPRPMSRCARAYGTSWTDSAGNFWLFGGSLTANGDNVLNDVWMFNPNTNQWTWESGNSTLNVAGTYWHEGTGLQ